MDGFTDTALEHALIGLGKLVKNAGYYSDGHPALNSAIQNALELLCSAMQRDNQPIVLAIKRQQFTIDDRALQSKNPLLLAMSERLFSHKVRQLTILPDLIDRHLLTLARLLGSEPATIAAQGGLQELLEQQQVSTIWANELDLSAIRSRKLAMEQQHDSDQHEISTINQQQASRPSPLLNSPEATLDELLLRLRQILTAPTAGSEAPFLHGLRQLTQIIHQLLASGERQKALPILRQLDAWIHHPQAPPRYVRVLKQAVASLSGKPLLDLLIDHAKETNQQPLVTRMISLLNSPELGSLLVQRLSEELDNKLRKYLSQLLVSMGEAVFGELIESLADERWFVCRNAIAILSESRSPQLIEHYIPLLHHPDGRVAKEAIRALARIKTEAASQALISQLESPQCEFPNQIILALGAQADPAAVPTLVRIACQRDPFLNQKGQVRDAIMALSEIGNSDCSTALITLLQRGKWVKRKEYNEIRCLAAAALGNLDDDASLTALEDCSQASNRELAAAARQALRQRRRT